MLFHMFDLECSFKFSFPCKRYFELSILYMSNDSIKYFYSVVLSTLSDRVDLNVHANPSGPFSDQVTQLKLWLKSYRFHSTLSEMANGSNRKRSERYKRKLHHTPKGNGGPIRGRPRKKEITPHDTCISLGLESKCRCCSASFMPSWNKGKCLCEKPWYNTDHQDFVKSWRVLEKDYKTTNRWRNKKKSLPPDTKRNNHPSPTIRPVNCTATAASSSHAREISGNPSNQDSKDFENYPTSPCDNTTTDDPPPSSINIEDTQTPTGLQPEKRKRIALFRSIQSSVRSFWSKKEESNSDDDGNDASLNPVKRNLFEHHIINNNSPESSQTAGPPSLAPSLAPSLSASSEADPLNEIDDFRHSYVVSTLYRRKDGRTKYTSLQQAPSEAIEDLVLHDLETSSLMEVSIVHPSSPSSTYNVIQSHRAGHTPILSPYRQRAKPTEKYINVVLQNCSKK